MSKVVISIQNLSKQYRLGSVGSGTLSEDLNRWWSIARGKEDPTLKIGMENKLNEAGGDYVYALKDINLEVKQGDVLGVVGKNGAGKSTLLKILSRITSPSSGTVDMYGRVASLLEVGTGFHAELTGRENIFLNGAIMGMSKPEIRSKFDEIVDFAGIGKYIDTPVKRYSSGMYVRLGFAVAAHLDPEILIVDEVLAVGDDEFQKKAIGKMQDVSKNEGRTVLFVSHNMNAVQQLCNKAVLLKTGQIANISDNVNEIIKNHLNDTITKQGLNSEWNKEDNSYENEYLFPLNFYFSDEKGNKSKGILIENEELYLNIIFDIKKVDPKLTIGYSVFDSNERLLYWSYQTDSMGISKVDIKPGVNHFKTRIPINILNEGMYRLEICGGLHDIKWFFEPGKNNPSIFLTVQGNASQSPFWNNKRPTILAPLLEWTVSQK